MQDNTISNYTHDHVIEHVIFDNDGTLYPEPADVKDKHMQAAIMALNPRYPHCSDDEIRDMIKQSQKEHKSSFGMFVADIECPEDRHNELMRLRDLHYECLSRLAFKNFFDQSASPAPEIGDLRIKGVNVHVATHGNLTWTKFSLEHNGGLSRFFNDTNIFTKDEVPDLAGKNEGTIFYEMLMNKMALPEANEGRGRNCAMVEDTAKNLIEAKRLGMMTILISDTMNEDDKPDYVDVIVRSNAKGAIQAVNLSNLQHEKTAAQKFTAKPDSTGQDISP